MAKRKRLIPTSFTSHNGAPDQKPSGAPFSEGRHAIPPIAQVGADAATQSALAVLSEEMIRARHEGRLTQNLRLDQIDVDYLRRDRLSAEPGPMEELITSIRTHGQRSPIEVADLGEGRYGLISGWRRLWAITTLSKEDADKFSHVQALIRHPAQASDAYIAMVEENEIRHGLSYYERARVVARAVEAGVFTDERVALKQLFAAASRPRRSKIGTFIKLYHDFDGLLRFPAAISERLGLALVKVIGEVGTTELVGRLQAGSPVDAETELKILEEFIKHQKAAPPSRGVKLPACEEVGPGMFLQTSNHNKHPSVILSGPAVDPHFLARLEAWLKQP